MLRLTIGLVFALLLAPGTAAAADVTDPELVSLSATPASVDVENAAATVTVTAHLRDAGGIDYAYTYYRGRRASGGVADSDVPRFTRISGTAQDGVWQATVTIPQGHPPGNYEYIGEIVDTSGNNLIYGTNLGNLPADAPAPLRVGLDPETSILSGPAPTSSSSSAVFAFDSDASDATFECRVDEGSWSSCSSPTTISNLSEGPHQFDVRATDGAGHVDASPATRSFTVDTSAPQTTIDSGPIGRMNDATPSFAFSSTEPSSSFECRVDAGAFAPCDSPKTTPALSDGSHTFEVRAIDMVGNADPSPATRAFVVDTATPQTVIDAGPTGTTNDNTPTFGFSSTESGSTFECRVDEATFAPCDSPETTTELADGSHTFAVRATDAAGNTDPTSATRAFTVDTTPPQTTIDTGPNGPINDNTPTFAFSSEAGASFECKLDGPSATTGSYAACTSPKDYASLADGSYTFSVRATDATGNTDGSAATTTFSVDATAPQTTIDTGPTGATNDKTPTFAFSSSETGSSFECRVDDVSFAPCGSPKTTAELDDGSHTFAVRATDAAGNTDATPATRTFTVDTGPPQTTIDAGPSGAVNDPSASFTFSSSEARSTFDCKLDGPGNATSNYSACTSPRDYSSLADGSYTFSVRATDNTDSTDPSPATRTFTVDTTAPQTTIDSGPTGTTSDATPTFAFTSSEAGSSYECRVDDASFAACTSPETTQVLSDSSHSFEVRATDPAGNSDSTAARRTFSVDTSAPQQADSDGDGVPNTRDGCPTQSAPTSDGCPSVAAPPQSSTPPRAQPDEEAPSLIGRTGLTRTIKTDSRGRLALTVGRFDEDVQGVIRLETTAKPSAGSSRSSAARKSKVRLGLKRFTARAGTKVVVRIRLSKSNGRLLNRTHKLKVRAILSTTDRAGNGSTKTYRFTLKAPSRTHA